MYSWKCLSVFRHFYSSVNRVAPIFNLAWFGFQFAWLMKAKSLLESYLKNVGTNELGAKEKLKGLLLVVKILSCVTVAFAAVERWMAQRFNAKGMQQNLKLFLMWEWVRRF